MPYLLAHSEDRPADAYTLTPSTTMQTTVCGFYEGLVVVSHCTAAAYSQAAAGMIVLIVIGTICTQVLQIT